MQSVLLDTNVLLAVFTLGEPAQHAAAVRLVRRAASGDVRLLVVPLVLFESYWVVRRVYRQERSSALDLIESVVNTPGVEVENAPRVRRAPALARKAKTDFADAYLAATAEEHDAALASFERRDFKRLGATLQRL